MQGFKKLDLYEFKKNTIMLFWSHMCTEKVQSKQNVLINFFLPIETNLENVDVSL